jgi:hypothetical protein
MDTLGYSQFLKNKKEVCETLGNVKQLASAKRKMETLDKKINYVKLFSRQGVQGLVGLLEIKKNKLPVVFKVSVELDKSVEHENSVLEALNEIKSFCPHFISSYGMYELPVCRSFIIENKDDSDDEEDYSTGSSIESISKSSRSSSKKSDTEEQSDEDTDEEYLDKLNLFTFDNEYSLNNVLFLEYVSDMSLKHVIKYSDRQLLYSQILCILCGLYIAQKHLNFTHYDLHIDNIMLKTVEDDSIFVYNLGTDAFIVPTFGVYPVIIDMGSSYCKNLEGQSMKTSTSHYNKGLQPTFYDNFNDMHHFLLSLFYSLEKEDESEYYFLSTRLLFLFRHLPVLRKKGWKILPNDILRNVRKYIKELCPSLYKLSSYHDMDKDFIEVLSYGVKLPWDDVLEEDIRKDYIAETSDKDVTNKKLIDFGLKKYFTDFFNDFQKFDEIEGFEDPYDLLYVLKEIADIVFLQSKSIVKNIDRALTKGLLNVLKNRLNCCLIDIPEDIDYGKMFYNAKMSISILKAMYFEDVIPNIEKINGCYESMDIKSPIDIIKFIKRNTSVRYVYSRHTVLYLWDSVGKTSKRIMLNSLIKNSEIDRLNDDHPALSENKILKLLKIKM